MKGCEAKRCLWQIQRGAARAKQGETKQSAGFDYVLPMVKAAEKEKPIEGMVGHATIPFPLLKFLFFSVPFVLFVEREQKEQKKLQYIESTGFAAFSLSKKRKSGGKRET